MRDSVFRPSRSLGQNFLIDANIAKKIVELSGVDKSSEVLEIGPGKGALTKLLAETARHVIAVELDKRLISDLRDVLSDYSNITFIQGDILKQDIKALISLPESDRHVCANLPYSITTPVIQRLIEADVFHTITIMVQKEVAERICAKQGTPQYGAFTIYVNYHTVPQILFDVPPECFSPRPKVVSSVVKLTMRSQHMLDEQDEKLFFKYVRAAFGQRRKTLVNALYAVLADTLDKEEILRAVESCGFDGRIRGEKLSIEDFVNITMRLKCGGV